jgi:hypothetical protein
VKEGKENARKYPYTIQDPFQTGNEIPKEPSQREAVGDISQMGLGLCMAGHAASQLTSQDIQECSI